MKYLLAFLVSSLLIISYFETCSAVTEPVCGYENAEGKTIFLKYYQGSKEGESYTEKLANGKCIKATCQQDYTLKTEEVPC